MIRINCSKPEDVSLFLPLMREEDRLECSAWDASRTAKEALEEGLKLSSPCFTATNEVRGGRIIGMGGFVPEPGTTEGAIWLLLSDEGLKFPKTLQRRTKDFLQLLQLRGVTRVYNHVWAKNIAHVKWVKRLGFTLRKPWQSAQTGELFIPFEGYLNV